MSSKYAAVIALLFLSYSICGAQTPQPTPEKRKPITSKWTTMDGLNYYYAGEKIKDMQTLRTITAPLNDAEINRLLNLSDSSHGAAIGLLVGGSACLIGGIIIADNNYDNGSQSLNSTGVVGALIGVAGFVADYVGIFKIAESTTSKYNAIQRYNAIVHGDEETSFYRTKPGIQTQLFTFQF